ncbi:hypothetical protein AMK16_26125 [Streptomyces sp. CB00455]|nr:hypothetical protein AMK16_26125 [Streptomyces sp. CB00455]
MRSALKGTKEQEDAAVERVAGRWIKLGADQSEAKGLAYGCQLAHPTVLLGEVGEAPEVSRGASAPVDG